MVTKNSKLIRIGNNTLSYLDKLKRNSSYDKLIFNLIKLSCNNKEDNNKPKYLNEVYSSNSESIDSLDKLKEELTLLLTKTNHLNEK